MKAIKIPNTFISDNGEIIFVNGVSYDKLDLIERDRCEKIVKSIEEKYHTSSTTEMIKQNITKKEMMAYITAKRDLIVIFGIDDE